MSKLTYEDRIEIYTKRKNGTSAINLSKQYGVHVNKINYLISLVDKNGLDILRKDKNKYYSIKEKERIISRVLMDFEPIRFVSIDEGLISDGMLQIWISKYKENGYNIVERKRGRPTMIKKPKQINKKETDKEKIERLEKENEYLKAELEYSKKLRAVVQARKNQQQKKK